ncbi:MAG: glycyl-radical enzyme activating protein [Holophaga sp.]|nr:glycyl-radical enzyme activating protein [Holophaga sp.]
MDEVDRTALVFHVQRFSLQDGPGLRTTIFLKGCPLACAWCHNPESQAPAPEMLKVESHCMRCGTCAEVDSDEAKVDVCPTGALRMAGRRIKVSELLEEVLRDRIFFEQSGGGVSFSGGEPLMQSDFVIAMATALRSQGIHVTLDTCGFARTEDLLRVSACVDLVLFDLKHLDDARHREVTGESNVSILANLKALSEVHRGIWIRVPVIPGINDDDANLEATASLSAQTPGVRRVDLLPYHAHGAAKFERIGKDYSFDAVLPPSAERMEALAERFRTHGLEVTIGGRA